MKTITAYLGLVTCMSLLTSSCDNYVDIDDPDSIIASEAVFTDELLATSAVKGLYHQLYGNSGFADGRQQSITVLSGLSSDELMNSPFFSNLSHFQRNDILTSNTSIQQLWSSAYSIIYMTNAIQEGLEFNEFIEDSVRRELLGEARFVRAFVYFHLVNLFGDVPLVLGTDYRENSLILRTPTSEVYDQILVDLLYAREELPEFHRGGEKTRPSRWTASALLARVHLYLENWAMAENFATEVLSSSQYALEELQGVFMANSQEALWQLAPLNSGNTNEGNLFILLQAPPNSFLYPVYLDASLVTSFDSEDQRLSQWVGAFSSGEETYYYPFKYKVRLSTSSPTEYSMVMRLAEQYLIRAESRIRQGKLQQGMDDLNQIRLRAGLENTGMTTDDELLEILFEERRKELFTEWGHRWLDLKRTGRASKVLPPTKTQWQPTDVLYPIPEREVERVPNMKQNDGY